MRLFLAGVAAAPAGALDTGLDATRMHADSTHAGALEFAPQALRKTAHAELGNVVGALRWKTDQAKHARDVDDATFTLRQHQRQESLAAVDHAPQVDAELPFDLVDLQMLERADHRRAGVVEHEVRGAKVPLHVVRVGEDRFTRGNIQRISARVDAGRQQAQGFTQTGAIDVGKRKSRTHRGELQCQCATDS